MSRQPVILNFDESTEKTTDAITLDLRHWQERIRFGCRWHHMAALEREITPQLPAEPGCVFTGSGDYHHLSWLLLRQLPASRPVTVIVCDNHPDNMRYPFGIHCGSWVYWASRLPQVAAIHVIGISSADIGNNHAWENHWRPLRNGKLTYWSVQRPAPWLRWIGRPQAARNFVSAQALIDAFCPQIGHGPVYLSIDKDVLHPDVVTTNWDQGQFTLEALLALIDRCHGQLVGADITGEVSLYHYQSRFKQILSAADGQQDVTPEQVVDWQSGQQAVNQQLLAAIDRAWE